MSVVGFVYVLRNEHINLVKIGYTDRNPHDRAEELSNFTGVPGKWRVCKSWRLSNAYDWEQRIFRELAAYRRGGEFFQLTPDKAIDLITLFLLNLNAINSDGLTQAEIDEIRAQHDELDKKTRRQGVDQKWKSVEHNYQKLAQREAERIFGKTLEQVAKEKREAEEDYNKSFIGVIDSLWTTFLIFTMMFWVLPLMIFRFFFSDGNPSNSSFPFLDRRNEKDELRWKIEAKSRELLLSHRDKFYRDNGIFDNRDS